MPDALTSLLDGRDWLLADGAMATTLFAMGLAAGTPPETWNRDRPDRVRAVHAAYVDAGSDVVLTNTFGGNAARLRRSGAGDRVRDLNEAGAALAREAAAQAGRRVAVAGAVGPTGEIIEPMGPLSFATAVEMFHEQAEALRAGGAELLWLETMSAADEVRAAAEAARRAGLPWCGTMSFDSAGRTMMGLTPQHLVDLAETLDPAPCAIGANCGTGPADLVRSILGFAARGVERPVIAKGSAGLPRLREGRLQYDATPTCMADYAVLARDGGARIVGGCCGTTPEHIAHMRTALETTAPGARPTLDVVTERLGPLSGTADTAPAFSRRDAR